MERALEQFIDRCINIADLRNLSDDNPIKLNIENPNSATKTIIVISVHEPYNYPLPLNVTWINFDPVSPYYRKALKRDSKQQSSEFQHTWTELEYINDVFVPDQYYEPGDDPSGITEQEVINHINSTQNPHNTTAQQVGALPIVGGQMTGAALARTLAQNEDYDENEFIPKSYVETFVGSSTVAQDVAALDSRVSALELNDPTDDVDIAQLQSDVSSLQQQVSQIPTNNGFIFDQATDLVQWTIAHNLNSFNLVVSVYRNNQLVVPSTVSLDNENQMTITFSEPVSGKAIIYRVV